MSLIEVLQRHPKVSALLLSGGVVQMLSAPVKTNLKHEDFYRFGKDMHAAQVEVLRMDWGNPLPFKSEILTKWGSRGAAYRARKFSEGGRK